MESLELSFNILSFCGVWRPLYYSTKLDNMLYDLYCIIFTPMPYLLVSCLVARLLLEKIDPDELAEAFFLTLTTFGVCAKSVNFIFWRKDITKLINKLTSKETKLLNNDEQDIWRPYDKIIRYSTVVCACLVQTSVVSWLVVPFFQRKGDRDLPFKIWLPYDLKPEKIFWITYLPEAIALISSSLIAIVCDTTISGFMIAICGQLDILSYRLQKLPNLVEGMEETGLPESEIDALENEQMVRHIRQHLSLLECAEAVSDTFRCTISIQFITSSIIISISVYQLSIVDMNSLEFFSKLLYVNSMLMEFFVYCWFGNELSLKSQEFGRSVIKMNWIILSPKSKKELLIVALRSMKPIVVSSGYFIVLSLDSFTKIMKASYTVFNVLRTSSVT